MVTETNSVDPGGTARIAEAERHRILADDRRRTVIEILRTSSGPVKLDVLATQLFDRKGESPSTDEESLEHVAIGLHHNHLPMMADLGIVAYDPETKYVNTCVDLDQLRA